MFNKLRAKIKLSAEKKAVKTVLVYAAKKTENMKNWKTMLTGGLLAAFVAVEPMITTGQVDYKKIGLAGIIALFSYLVKDKDVTGGSIKQ